MERKELNHLISHVLANAMYSVDEDLHPTDAHGIAGKLIKNDKSVKKLIEYIDQLEAEKKALTHKELLLMAKKVVKLADNMINTFETMEEDQCWEMAIMAALIDNQFREKELISSVKKAEDDIYYCNSCHAFFEEECACCEMDEDQ